MTRKFWVALSAAVVLLLLPLGLVNASTLGHLRQEQHQTEAQLNATKKAYAETQSAVYDTLTQIQNLNQTLSADRARVAALDRAVSETQARLTATQRQIVRLHRHLVFEASLLSGQVRLMEENGSLGYLDVVLGAHSFADFISRLYMLGQLANMAGSMVSHIRATEALEAQKKASLAKQEQYLVGLQNQVQAASSEVSAALGHQQVLATNLRQQEAQQQALMQQLNQKLASITSQIQSLLNQYHGGALSLHQLYDSLYPLVQPIAKQFSLPPALIIAVITEESGGNARAVSSANAIGLMQVEPGTASAMGYPESDLYNPQENVLIGCTYLADMLDLFGKSPSAASNVTPSLATPPGNAWSYLSAALAAYNAGPGAVESYGLAGLFNKPWGVQQYVTNIENLYLQYTGWGTP